MTEAIVGLKPLIIPDSADLIEGGASQSLMYLLNDIKSRFDLIQGYQEPVVPAPPFVIQKVTFVDSSEVTISNGFPTDNTRPQITEGDLAQSVSFTPKKSDSKILIEWKGFVSRTASSTAAAALFTSGSTDAIDATFVFSSTAGGLSNANLVGELDSWGTTARTISARIGALSSTVFLNSFNGTSLYGGALCSVMRITEYQNSA